MARQTRTGASALLCLVAAAALFGLLPIVLLNKNDTTVTLYDPTSSLSQSQEWFLGKQEPCKTESAPLTDKRIPDGTFNGGPVYLQTRAGIQSKVHCVGENYQKDKDSWKERSCRFSFICLNMTSNEYVVFQSPSEQEFTRTASERPFLHASSTLFLHNTTTPTVALGGINPRWTKADVQRINWFPDIVPINPSSELTYYSLPDEVVLIPYHSLNSVNPGHLVWDDYLPIYNLLDMFDLKHRELLPLRHVLQDDGLRALWASCDVREERLKQCNAMIRKFRSLLVGHHSRYNYSTQTDYDFEPLRPNHKASELVCAKTGVAGIGSLTDHGTSGKTHGWTQADYETTHNHGRGGLLRRFRDFMVQNMGLPVRPLNPEVPHRIVVSLKSSRRLLDFTREIKLLKRHFPNATVEEHVMKDLSLQQQVEIANNATIFITLCGGGAVTAMFLPPGASVILYFDEALDAKMSKGVPTPARLDWDLLNAMSHLRVHWMPIRTRFSDANDAAFVQLIQHELELVESQAFS